MKNIALLGSTGSIGTNTCAVVEASPEHFRLVGMAAGKNLDLFEEQVRKFRPSVVSMISESDVEELRKRLGNPKDIVFCSGDSGIVEVATCSSAEMVLVAVVGGSGLVPTAAAIDAGKDIALANKETMVMGGEVITGMAKRAGVKIIPVDSEHNAIFQCLAGNAAENVEKLILTASGGPFLRHSKEALEVVTPKEALKHPNWSMGDKVSIDSATLMNKGFEVIEAYWLFGCSFDTIEVIVHPQSIVHSMVQYIDGSVIAQMGSPDMKLPIMYAMSYPKRFRSDVVQRLDFSSMCGLSFEAPDTERFPCLRLAFEALRAGQGACVVLNAANEIAVEAFLNGSLPFCGIWKLVEETLVGYNPVYTAKSIEDILKIDSWARKTAQEKYERFGIC